MGRVRFFVVPLLAVLVMGWAVSPASAQTKQARGTVTGGALRDRTGIGRTLAIEGLEYFDRIKFTRRAGNEHHVIRPAREALGDD